MALVGRSRQLEPSPFETAATPPPQDEGIGAGLGPERDLKTDSSTLAHTTARLLDAVRAAQPLVQSITNFVSMDVAANALLALGASPAMVHAPEESGDFVRLAGALVCNIGTLSATWLESMEMAATAAHMHGTPWVLDPVGAGATKFRNEAVVRLMRHRPAVVRGNASEVMAVAKALGLATQGATPKGVDTANTTDEAADIAVKLARHMRGVVAATGAVDLITDGQRSIRLGNGSPLMARVTALGCALSGIVGAFLAVGDDPLEATAAAVAVYGIAGEIAAERAARPGSVRVAFLDALDEVGTADISARLRII